MRAILKKILTVFFAAMIIAGFSVSAKAASISELQKKTVRAGSENSRKQSEYLVQTKRNH